SAFRNASFCSRLWKHTANQYSVSVLSLKTFTSFFAASLNAASAALIIPLQSFSASSVSGTASSGFGVGLSSSCRALSTSGNSTAPESSASIAAVSSSFFGAGLVFCLGILVSFDFQFRQREPFQNSRVVVGEVLFDRVEK